MWAAFYSILSTLLTSFLKGWWAEHEQKKELADAVSPYKKELAIKERPAGSDDDVIGKL